MDARRSIPITKPYFGEAERQAVLRPLESGWLVQGPFVQEFENKFTAFTGTGHSIATSSCTTALHLGVTALGLKPGDEVIVPAFTWVSTPNVVEYMGARPVFCDIRLDTFNIDVEQIRSKITERTVGIIAVHLFGLCADLDPILAIAREHGLWVVEDAACAFGAWDGDAHAGTRGDVGCFSFHPRKSITTGEGGMVTTSQSDMADRLRSLRDHGASRSDFERHSGQASYLLAEYNMLGYNYRMTDVQAAIGCAQMDRAEWILEQRSRCARVYDDLLEETSWLRLPRVPVGMKHGYQAYVTLFAPDSPTMDNVDELHERRNGLMARLEGAGVATRPGTHAAALQGYYVAKYGLDRSDFPQSHIADRISLALPLFAQMEQGDLEYVVEALIDSAGSGRA